MIFFILLSLLKLLAAMLISQDPHSVHCFASLGHFNVDSVGELHYIFSVYYLTVHAPWTVWLELVGKSFVTTRALRRGTDCTIDHGTIFKQRLVDNPQYWQDKSGRKYASFATQGCWVINRLTVNKATYVRAPVVRDVEWLGLQENT